MFEEDESCFEYEMYSSLAPKFKKSPKRVNEGNHISKEIVSVPQTSQNIDEKQYKQSLVKRQRQAYLRKQRETKITQEIEKKRKKENMKALSDKIKKKNDVQKQVTQSNEESIIQITEYLKEKAREDDEKIRISSDLERNQVRNYREKAVKCPLKSVQQSFERNSRISKEGETEEYSKRSSRVSPHVVKRGSHTSVKKHPFLKRKDEVKLVKKSVV